MKKVYVIQYDDCEPYEDNYTWIGEVFGTYRAASNYLLKKDFKIEYFKFLEDIGFYKEIEAEYGQSGVIAARIIETDFLGV